MKIRQLTKADVKIQMWADRDKACPSIEQMLDAEELIKAEESISIGHLWGWSVITVRVVHGGFYGDASLCGCVYNDADDFMARSYSHYESLVERALVELNNKVAQAYEDLQPLLIKE